MAERRRCGRPAPEAEHFTDPIRPCVRAAEPCMNIRLHLQIVGALLIALGAAQGLIGRYLGWKKDLERVSLLTRQVFEVLCFFIGLLLILLGVCSFFYADALLEPGPLPRAILAGILIFWLCRLLVQWFVYDP